MKESFTRYANAVKLHYLQYEESKKTERPTEYLKHLPSYLTIIPEYVDEMGMLFLDNENNELIYTLRGLDFDLIKQSSPYVIAGASSGSVVGGAVGKQMQAFMGNGRSRNSYASTGKLIGAGVGSYLFGNREVKTALDILLSGAFNQQKELDPETDQIKQGMEKRFMNEYIDDLNREILKIRDIQATFPNTKLVLSGHSRGAMKTKDLTDMLGLEGHLFNPAEATVYGNIMMQILMPMLITDSTSDRQFIRQNLIEGYDEDVRAFPTIDRQIYSPEDQPLSIAIRDIADVTLSPERPLRSLPLTPNSPLREYIEREYPTFQADIFNPFPRLNNFLQSETHDFGTFGHATEGETALIRTAIGMNVDSPVNMKTIAEAAAKYASLRYGGDLIKYSIEQSAGQDRTQSIASQLLGNPFTLVTAGTLTSKLLNPADRIETLDENLFVYRTPDDLVSKGYSDKFNIEPKEYVENSFIEDYIIGQHTIDHFISQALYNSVNKNQPINNDMEQQLRIAPPPTPEAVNENIMNTQSQVVMGVGTPMFKKLNIYDLCQQDPTQPFCEDFLK